MRTWDLTLKNGQNPNVTFRHQQHFTIFLGSQSFDLPHCEEIVDLGKYIFILYYTSKERERQRQIDNLRLTDRERERDRQRQRQTEEGEPKEMIISSDPRKIASTSNDYTTGSPTYHSNVTALPNFNGISSLCQ